MVKTSKTLSGTGKSESVEHINKIMREMQIFKMLSLMLHTVTNGLQRVSAEQAAVVVCVNSLSQVCLQTKPKIS